MTQAELLKTAFAHHQAGRTAEAEGLYRQILAHDPQQPETLHLLGVLCMQSDRGTEAIELLTRAVALRPKQAEFANHLGAAYGSLERHDEAIAVLRRAVRIAPRDAGVHYNLGTALRNAGRFDEAVASFRHSLAANPNAAEAHYNLGNTLRELKKFDEAEAAYRDALGVRPEYMKALVNLGNVLRDQKRYDESIETLRSAVALDANHASAHLNLGTVLRDAGQFAEAVESLRRAVSLAPHQAEAHNNLGTALQALARFDEAGDCYAEALRLDPDLAEAHFSRATWRIRQGDLLGGFEEYEWRWKCSTFHERGFEQTRWDGSPLAGRTLLLYAEQGLGDTLHFVRYAANARARGGRVIVECQKPLVKLLAACPAVEQVIALGSPLPHFDVHAPLLSLPAILKLSEAQLWDGPYLAADPRLVATWRDRLVQNAGFRIGICWHGNPQNMFNAQRSFPLTTFEPIARVSGVRLISLQRDARDDELASAGFEVLEAGPQIDDQAEAFCNTAAMVKNLDLVITTDTSIAHLAGGLGVPVWLALSAHVDWRWMLDREDTPWYPLARLFRQSELGRWDDVFARMTTALEKLVASPR